MNETYKIGDIIESNNYGKFKIIDIIHEKYKHTMARVKFIDTGYEYTVQYSSAIRGMVKDPTYFMYTVKDKIFYSKYYGEFKIIEDYGSINKYRRVKIKFLNTGYESVVRADDALNGEVKDHTFKNAYEARAILGPYKIQNIERTLSGIHKDMIRRCYDNNCSYYNTYGAKGVKVSDEWFDVNKFIFDAQHIPGWCDKYNDPLNYHLDKDLFQYNLPYEQRIYSKETCIWLPIDINVKLSTYGYNIMRIHYDHIYEVYGLFYIKVDIPGIYNYGPFYNLLDAIFMLNSIYNNFDPINNPLTKSPNKKIMCVRI